MRRFFNDIAPITSLTADAPMGSATLDVASTTDYPPAPLLVGIERGSDNEEVCLCTSYTLTTMTVDRGYGTDAKDHDAGSSVEHVVADVDYDEANAHINDTLTGAGVTTPNPRHVIICTSGTRPTHVEGQLIYETDTKKLLTDDGAAWNPVQGIAVCTSTTRPTTGLYEGYPIYETNTDLFAIYTGSAWRYHSGIQVVTSITRPTVGLYNGLFIYETDTFRLMKYNGSAWVTQAAPIAADSAVAGVNLLDDVTIGAFHGWAVDSALVNVAIGGVGSAIAGTPPARADMMGLLQAGTVVVTTDAFANVALNFPVAFPNGLLGCVVMNGDTGANTFFPESSPGSSSRFAIGVHCHGVPSAVSGSSSVRLSYVAVGW